MAAVFSCALLPATGSAAMAPSINQPKAVIGNASKAVRITIPNHGDVAWKRMEFDFQVVSTGDQANPGREEGLSALDFRNILPEGLMKMSAWTDLAAQDEDRLQSRLIIDLEKQIIEMYIDDKLMLVSSSMMPENLVDSDAIIVQLTLVTDPDGISAVPAPAAFGVLLPILMGSRSRRS